MIPMVDLKTQYEQLKNEIDQAVLEVLGSCHYILGPNVKAFEEESANALGVEYAIGCASGTDALHLALRAMDLKRGEEVITTPFTFFASCEAISLEGGEPVFVDIEENTFNIDPNRIEDAITPKTRAIIPVHLYGLSVDMDAINTIAKQHNLVVIEDSAQAFGAKFKGSMAGGMGHMGCFSFYPSKTLGAFGDGGMVTTNSAEFNDRLKALRDHGSHGRYNHVMLGVNSRLDEIQAAILRIKLRHIDDFNHGRRRVAAVYNTYLKDCDVITPDSHNEESYYHVYHQYTILHPEREKIAAALKANNIASAVHYPKTVHRQPVYEKHFQDLSLPISERISEQCLSLPMYPEMTESQIQQVAEVIKETI